MFILLHCYKNSTKNNVPHFRISDCLEFCGELQTKYTVPIHKKEKGGSEEIYKQGTEKFLRVNSGEKEQFIKKNKLGNRNTFFKRNYFSKKYYTVR